MIKRGSSWSALAVLLLVCTFAPTAHAQGDALLQEAVNLYERGRDDEGLAKLRELLAQDPSSSDAMRLRDAIEYRRWVKIMIQGDQHASVVNELFNRALPAARAKTADADAIKALVAKLDTDDWAERTKALRILAADHGEYAAPHLISRFANQDTDARAGAMEWTRRLGTQAVLPLIQALESSDEMVRGNAATVLGQIGDVRAAPYLMAAGGNPNNPPSVREAATRALGDMSPSTAMMGDAKGAMLQLAERYYQRDTGVVDPFRRLYAVWHMVDGNIVAHEVPRDVYHLKLAEDVLYDLLAMSPGHAEATVLLASTLLAQADAAAGAEDDAANALKRARVLAAAGGPAVLNGVVAKALADGRPGVATGAVELLASQITAENFSAPNGLTMGLNSNYKAVRYRSAIALGRIAPQGMFDGQARVVSTLAESLSQDATRSAVVIDDNTETRNQIVADLNARGWFAYGVDKGSLGVARVRDYPIEDLVVIRYDLKDQTVSQVVKILRDDPRTSERPIAMICEAGDMDTAKNGYEGRVQAFIATPPVADAYEPQLRGLLSDLEGERKEATMLAAHAANVLAGMNPQGGAYASASAADALAASLTGHDDTVRIPAIKALGRIANASTVPALMTVLNDGSASEPARGNAAIALAHVISRSGQDDGSFAKALAGLLGGEGSLEFMTMLGEAAGIAPMSTEQRSMLMNALRSRVMVDLQK